MTISHLAGFMLGLAAVGSVCAAGDAWPPLPPSEMALRGCEECGRFLEDNPGWSCHMPTLFITRKNPDVMWQTAQEHINWTKDPLHSYVADGTGGLNIIAHPGRWQDELLATLKGLDGMEVCHGGDFSKEANGRWDRAITARLRKGLNPLWGFAADDTHSWSKGDRSWLAARLDQLSERSLKAALRSGGFYVSTGPVITDIQVKGPTITVTLAQDAEVQWLKSGQYGKPTRHGIAPAEESTQRGEGRAVKVDRAVRTSSYTLNDKDGTTDPEQALFVRCIVVTPDDRAAMTQPFVIRSASSVDNPYPATGKWYKGMTHNHSDALPGQDTKIAEYYAGYASLGHAFAFETGYDYWCVPFQAHPPERTPVIDRLEPMRLPAGTDGKAMLLGRAFAEGAEVLLNGKPLSGFRRLSRDRIELTIPTGLSVGRYDLTVRNPDGFQDTLQYALVIQASDKVNAGWRIFTPHNSKLGAAECYTVTADRDGGVWIASNYGLNHFDGRDWQLYRRPKQGSGPLADVIYDVFVEPNGTLWYTCFRGVGSLAGSGQWRQWPCDKPESGVPGKQINRVLRLDETYITVFNRPGLYVLAGDKWQMRAPPGGKAPAFHGLTADPQGRLWIGSEAGLYCWDPRRGEDGWEHCTSKDGLPDDWVRVVTFDPKGRLWIATTTKDDGPRGGLACLDDGKWVSYTMQNSPLPERRVWALCADRSGNIWAGTSKGAACLRPDGTWRIFTVVNSGLADNLVTGIAQDKAGHIWFATANGVSRLDPSAIELSGEMALREGNSSNER